MKNILIYTYRSLFITSCSTFRLIKAFIKKVFLSMCNIERKTFLIKASMCNIERKTFLIKALISRNVEQDVMNKLQKVYVTKTVRE